MYFVWWTILNEDDPVHHNRWTLIAVNEKYIKNPDEALVNNDGFLMLAILFYISDDRKVIKKPLWKYYNFYPQNYHHYF